jgi:hypothetical protein
VESFASKRRGAPLEYTVHADELTSSATRQVLQKCRRNLTGQKNPVKTLKPLTASQLANRYGLEPTTIANLKASQAKLKEMGRDLTLEQVYALEVCAS